MLNLDCAHFFLSVWWKKIKLQYTISLIFLQQHFMSDCQWGVFLSSMQVTLIRLSMVAKGIGNLVTWFADTINTDSKLMFNLTVLCFCQFCACFLSHMPLEFAKHVNLRNSKKPKRSLKPIHQSSCYMMTGELFSLKYWRKIITEWQGIKWISV